MSVDTLLWLVLAGVGTGLVGYLTGLASVVSYPALLAAGLPPLAANVTNTVSLVAIGVGSTAKATSLVFRGSTSELGWQSAVALAGGVAGAVLLVGGGEGAFTAVVPWLMLLASATVLLSPRLRTLASGRQYPVLYLVGLFAICVYGGYFGAGAGVLYLAITLIGTAEGMGRAMALKSFLLGLTNLVSAVIFVVLGPVAWPPAVALAVGCFAGGVLGPVVQQWVPDAVLRWTVAVSGIALAVWLWQSG